MTSIIPDQDGLPLEAETALAQRSLATADTTLLWMVLWP